MARVQDIRSNLDPIKTDIIAEKCVHHIGQLEDRELVQQGIPNGYDHLLIDVDIVEEEVSREMEELFGEPDWTIYVGAAPALEQAELEMMPQWITFKYRGNIIQGFSLMEQ